MSNDPRTMLSELSARRESILEPGPDCGSGRSDHGLAVSTPSVATMGWQIPSRRVWPIAVICVVAGWVFATGAIADTVRPSKALETLLDDVWQQQMEDSPLFATQVGVEGFDALLPRVRIADVEASRDRARGFLERLDAIDRAALERQEQINADLLRRDLESEIRSFELGTHLMPFTTYYGFYLSFPGLPDDVPLDNVTDYENYIARLAAFSTYVDDNLELLRAGIARGLVLPRSVLLGWEGSVDPHIVSDPEESLLWEPLAELPETIGSADAERLRAAARTAIEDSVVAGYQTFRDFMVKEYMPATRESVGASALPRGKEIYEEAIRQYTTTDLTAEEIHALGLSEVQRIRAEMLEVIAESGFEGDFDAFVEFLRQDPRFYAKTPEELLEKVSRVLKRMDGKLPELFRVLPRMPYGIKEIPDYLAPKTTTAYYGRPAGDGTRSGTYWVNTYALESRPLYEIEALSFHEAVPGHHLQIALAQELDLPPIRRYASVGAFVEGWGLYSERLGLEVGFYEDPYSNFGRLSYEMWRALRLVVDTGIHAKGWGREQAIDFMAANSALTLHNITAEVDRYISWPGQALGYKIGELKIRELRSQAEASLGEDFDLREFHEVVLRDGPLPLSVLQDSVHLWLAQKKEKASLAEGNAPAAFDSYWMVFLMRGDQAAKLSDAELGEIQRGHLAHLSRLHQDGHTLVAGPFEAGETEPMRGIVLYPGDLTEEEVRALAEDDPAVRAGRLRIDLRKWWTGAGAVTFPRE
ncbi:MAG: DUF885 family protein [Thermoanaerobaculia bacterium]|nr:DUF885 family protein [Thermoanaerobaculia bacterium]